MSVLGICSTEAVSCATSYSATNKAGRLASVLNIMNLLTPATCSVAVKGGKRGLRSQGSPLWPRCEAVTHWRHLSQGPFQG